MNLFPSLITYPVEENDVVGPIIPLKINATRYRIDQLLTKHRTCLKHYLNQASKQPPRCSQSLRVIGLRFLSKQLFAPYTFAEPPHMGDPSLSGGGIGHKPPPTVWLASWLVVASYHHQSLEL